jgi:hypothetical protein
MANHSQSGILTKKYNHTSLQSQLRQNGAISNPNPDQINRVREILVAMLNHGRRNTDASPQQLVRGTETEFLLGMA